MRARPMPGLHLLTLTGRIRNIRNPPEEIRMDAIGRRRFLATAAMSLGAMRLRDAICDPGHVDDSGGGGRPAHAGELFGAIVRGAAASGSNVPLGRERGADPGVQGCERAGRAAARREHQRVRVVEADVGREGTGTSAGA